MIAIDDTWYRYQERHYAPEHNSDGDFISNTGTVEVHLMKFSVVRITPKGVWVAEHLPMKHDPRYDKLIVHTWRKKYAHPTEWEALTAFRCRKLKNISIYEARIRSIHKALTYAKRYEPDDDLLKPRPSRFSDLRRTP